MQILSGDIGGTKTRLALMEATSAGVDVKLERTYRSADYASLEELTAVFLADAAPRPDRASFGIAGPVRDGRCAATNLPWVVDSSVLREQLGLHEVFLLNDLEATAWGIQALGDDDLLDLHLGVPDPEGNLAVVAAGTGLGEAGVMRRGGVYRPFATEGGHTDFAPISELEFALMQHLSRSHGHVSWERVVSGMGIVDVYRFLCRYQAMEPPDWLANEMVQGDAAAAISQAAEAGRCELCERTLDLFVQLYGREAGNHALKVMATGGVYIGGGIAPKILPRLQEARFLDNFFNKGRMEPLLRAMPVRIILNDRAALYGPALAAASMDAVAAADQY